MKLKPITITEKNIKEVYGKIRKFFYNKNRTGFIEWHNFDCGFKRKISPYIFLDMEKGPKKIRITILYPSPEKINLYKKEGTITTMITTTDGFSLHYGDKIAFCSNRIITKEKSSFPSKHSWLYTVFQAYPMTEEKQYELRKAADELAAIYERDYYEEYERDMIERFEESSIFLENPKEKIEMEERENLEIVKQELDHALSDCQGAPMNLIVEIVLNILDTAEKENRLTSRERKYACDYLSDQYGYDF